MSKMMQMHANLMGAPAVQNTFHETDPAARAQDAVIGACGPATHFCHRHALAMHGVTSDRRIDDSAFFLHCAGDKRQINLLDFARGKLSRKLLMRGVVL